MSMNPFIDQTLHQERWRRLEIKLGYPVDRGAIMAALPSKGPWKAINRAGLDYSVTFNENEKGRAFDVMTTIYAP